MRDDGGHGASSIFLSFLLGGVIGAGFALLLAPKTGREMRKQIRDLADETKERASGYMDQTKERFHTAVEKGKGIYEEQRSALTSAVEAGKDAYGKEKEKHIKKADA